jgi:hypothetical protein
MMREGRFVVCGTPARAASSSSSSGILLIIDWPPDYSAKELPSAAPTIWGWPDFFGFGQTILEQETN